MDDASVWRAVMRARTSRPPVQMIRSHKPSAVGSAEECLRVRVMVRNCQCPMATCQKSHGDRDVDLSDHGDRSLPQGYYGFAPDRPCYTRIHPDSWPFHPYLLGKRYRYAI